VIYGANASGKSNLIKAMGFMRDVIANSLKLNPEEPIVSTQSYPSFQLHSKSAEEPLEMEISFLYQDVYYRYGFALDADRIHREWLYFAPQESESLLYERRFEEGLYVYDIPETFLIAKDFRSVGWVGAKRKPTTTSPIKMPYTSPPIGGFFLFPKLKRWTPKYPRIYFHALALPTASMDDFSSIHPTFATKKSNNVGVNLQKLLEQKTVQ